MAHKQSMTDKGEENQWDEGRAGCPLNQFLTELSEQAPWDTPFGARYFGGFDWIAYLKAKREMRRGMGTAALDDFWLRMGVPSRGGRPVHIGKTPLQQIGPHFPNWRNTEPLGASGFDQDLRAMAHAVAIGGHSLSIDHLTKLRDLVDGAIERHENDDKRMRWLWERDRQERNDASKRRAA